LICCVFNSLLKIADFIKQIYGGIVLRKIYIAVLLLLSSTKAFSISCVPDLGISEYYLFYDNSIIVSFNVIDSHTAYYVSENYMDIQITHEFNSNQITDTDLRIYSEGVYKYTKGTEWVGVLLKNDDSYVVPLCAPALSIENGNIIGKTGMTVLDEGDSPVSIELFDTTLSVFQQGLSLADTVCQSASADVYCVKRATYDLETGILDLPSVSYLKFGFREYNKAKLQKMGDNPMTFSVQELGY